MQSFEVLRKVFKKVGPKNMASAMNLSVSLIYQWARGGKDKSEALNPLDRVLMIMRVSGSQEPLHWLCQQAGGFFVANPPEEAAGKKWDVARAEQGLLHDVGAFQQAFAEAMECPGSAERRAGLRVSWEGLKTSGEGLVRVVERGWLRLVWWYGLWDALTPGGLW